MHFSLKWISTGRAATCTLASLQLVSLSCTVPRPEPTREISRAEHLLEFLTAPAEGPTNPQFFETDTWSQMDDRDTVIVSVYGHPGTTLQELSVRIERVKMSWPDGHEIDSMNPALTPSERWVDVPIHVALPLSLTAARTEVLGFAIGAIVRGGKAGDSLEVVGLRVSARTSDGRAETRVLRVLGPD